MRFVANAVMFQCGWWVCVLGGTPWALAYAAFALGLHGFLFGAHRRDALAAGLAIGLGLLHDGLLIGTGLLTLPEGGLPLWLSALWLLLGLTLHHSARALYHRPVWAGALGALLGPASYTAGVALVGGHWHLPLWGLFAGLAGVWAILLPLHRYLYLKAWPYVYKPIPLQ